MSAPTTWAATEDNIGGNKVDDRVRMFRNASGYDGEFGTVRALDRDHGWRVWVNPDGAPYGLAVRMDPDDLERILAEVDLPDATPASLDPSKVKAGDTVTLTKGETSVRGPVTGISYAGGGEWDFRVGEEAYRRAGRIGLWAVTAHQPAPEPEPEWKPGMFASARIRGYEQDGERYQGFFDSEGSFYFPDAEGRESAPHKDSVTDVRPLVVIDPAAVRDEIEAAGRRLVAAHAKQPRAENVDVYVAQVFAALGIEVTS